ncbi:DinB family protein [Ornithinibacillus salinisoli]|uniref:DinB family protein n=1 Tax=Ornithinibacillus salinisoli TaxID=1848459 RepID=A0ABW4W3J1_9BACI
MNVFFQYNWQVRDEWFDWCQQLSDAELVKQRTGGMGNILHTLLHIIDVEHSWIQAIQGKDDKELNFNDFTSLHQVKSLSDSKRNEVEAFLKHDNLPDDHPVTPSWIANTFRKDEVLKHIIAHEIHHVGQLSIWARELDLKPISANLIGRGLYQ